MTESLAGNPLRKPLIEQLHTYDDCFTEFLQSASNGQKHMQSILLREAFSRFSKEKTGIQADRPTAVLDVSCGPGGYSAAWTAQVSSFLPHGMQFYCTDYKGGKCSDGTPYTAATSAAIKTAASQGSLNLAGEPVGTEADLFSGAEPIIPAQKAADIVHWSHSGYYVCDALGDQKNDAQAIERGLSTAVDKMWSALDEKGLMFSMHQIEDESDNVPNDQFRITRKHEVGFIGDIPERINRRIETLGGKCYTVKFVTPVVLPVLSPEQWESLKDPKRWDYLNADQARTLRMLSFFANDFSDSAQSGLGRLMAEGRLAPYIDDFREIVRKNKGQVMTKCAFQIICKSPEIASKLESIANDLTLNMPHYQQEMRGEMLKAASQQLG